MLYKPVENVVLDNIEITYKGKADKTINYFPIDSLKIITEAEKDYPEFSMFGELPVSGMFVRHIKGLSMDNIKLNYAQNDFRTAIFFLMMLPSFYLIILIFRQHLL